MAEVIKNRYEFVVLFDVENGNPNGDPEDVYKRQILLWLLSVPAAPSSVRLYTKTWLLSSLTRKNCLWSLSKIPWRGPVPLSKASSDTRVKSFWQSNTIILSSSRQGTII